MKVSFDLDQETLTSMSADLSRVAGQLDDADYDYPAQIIERVRIVVDELEEWIVSARRELVRHGID